MDIGRLAILSAVFQIFFTFACYAFDDARIYIPRHEGQIELPSAGNVAYEDFKGAASWLASELSSISGVWKAVPANKNQDTYQMVFHIGKMNKEEQVPYKRKDRRYEESYRIDIDKTVSIQAGGAAGAFYAVQTLMRMLRKDAVLESATLIDYPDYRWRGVVIKPGNTECKDPLRMTETQRSKWLGCMRAEIDRLSGMRLNLVALLSPVFSRMNNDDLNLMAQLIAHARERNVELMPVIDTKLWGIPVEQLNVDAIEGVLRAEQGFLVKNGSLEAQNGFDDVSWEYESSSRSWEGQGQGSKRWASKVLPSTKGIGRYAFVFNSNDGSHDPWKNTLLLKHPGDGEAIPVEPGGYYELGIRVENGSDFGDAHILVGVSQYDKSGSRIKGLNRYPVKLRATRGEAVKRWVSVFTSEDTHSILVRLAPSASGKRPVRIRLSDIELRSMSSRLVNVLHNAETVPVVKSSDGRRSYKEGPDYKIDYAPVKEWRGRKFKDIGQAKITIPPGSRLKSGDRIVMTYDVLPLEYRALPRSKYSAVSNYTYQEYSRLFSQFSRLPLQFLQVSFSEHSGGLNRDSRSRGQGKNNRELLVSYMNNLDLMLRSEDVVVTPEGGEFKGAGAGNMTLVVWDDMLNPWHNGGDNVFQVGFGGPPGATGLTVEKDKTLSLSDSIWISSWWYRNKDVHGVIENTPEFYSALGFNYFVAAWYQSGAINQWFKVADPNKVQGFIATTWNGNYGGVRQVACSAWNRQRAAVCGSLK